MFVIGITNSLHIICWKTTIDLSTQLHCKSSSVIRLGRSEAVSDLGFDVYEFVRRFQVNITIVIWLTVKN